MKQFKNQDDIFFLLSEEHIYTQIIWDGIKRVWNIWNGTSLLDLKFLSEVVYAVLCRNYFLYRKPHGQQCPFTAEWEAS